MTEAMLSLLPWHQPQWFLLANAYNNRRLGHALLLRGREGSGVAQFAARFAAALACQQQAISEHWPCGVCRGCKLSVAGSHPDLMIVEPDEGKTAIGIDQARRLIDALGLAPKLAGPKVAILLPSESLTREAANSLLKTLEEPPGDVVFLLVCHSSTKLPLTVRSRCQVIDFPTPSRHQARQWLTDQVSQQPADVDLALDIAGGAPFRALDMLKQEHLLLRSKVFESFVGVVSGQADPFEVARLWRLSGTNEALRWLASFAADCIKVQCVKTSPRIVNHDLLAELTNLVQDIEPHRLYELWDYCIQANKDHNANTGLNDQLLLDGVAMTCTALAAQPRTSSSFSS